MKSFSIFIAKYKELNIKEKFGKNDEKSLSLYNNNESVFNVFNKSNKDYNLKPIEAGYMFVSIKGRMLAFFQNFTDEYQEKKHYSLGETLIIFFIKNLIGKRIRIRAKKNKSNELQLYDFILSDMHGDPDKLNYRFEDTDNNFYDVRRTNTPLLDVLMYDKIIYHENDPFMEDDWGE
jgi:hypothetical protein